MFRKAFKRTITWSKSMIKRCADWGIKSLRKLSNRLNQAAVPNPYFLDDLSPVDNIENGEPYFKSLEWALKNKDIQNIAVTGPYGSGKSSVIRSFEKTHPEYNYLNISLASFQDGANTESPQPIPNKITADEHRLVEISILQQIFYKVKAKSIPDSRFKRIKSLGMWQIFFYTILIVSVFISLFVLLNPTFFNKFQGWEIFQKNNNKTIPYISAGIILSGIIILSIYFIRFFSSRQFEKLNISSGEIAIQADNEKSILNKHLDEILYFFEVNPYNVVIIEDLDRFKNHEIFTKLREINFLLNNSRQINRKIVFIYALKDDMFLDKTRTKFFEFILPVIPVVNWSNSFSKLSSKLIEPSLNLNIDEKFVRDITLYIDDMRILKNIFNEFIVYKENLKGLSINQTKLLGIVIYKNIYPTDFAELHENRGIVFNVFKQLANVKSLELETVNAEITEIKSKIEKAEAEMPKNINELRSIYLSKITEIPPYGKALYLSGNKYTFAQAKKDDVFDLLIKAKNIQVYSDDYSQSSLGKTFTEIETLVDPLESYQKRVINIDNKQKSNLDKLKSTLAKLTQQKSQIASYSLKEFLDAHPTAISLFDKPFLEKEQLVYLLREGYIDEMYTSLTSYFYEGSFTKNDMDYLLSIKNRTPLEFNLHLTKLDEVLKGITRLEIKLDAVLNFSFVDYLLSNTVKYKEEADLFFSHFSNKAARRMEFIHAYLDKGHLKGKFVAKLSESWPGFWETISQDNKITTDTKDQILRLLITNADASKVGELDRQSLLSNYISDKPDFLFLAPEKDNIEKVKNILDHLNVKFDRLITTEETDELFTYIYENSYYQINSGMIHLIITIKGNKKITDDELETANYSAVINSGCDDLIRYIEDNIDTYISNVFLELDYNTHDPEDILIQFLNNDAISVENKNKIIEQVESKIKEVTTVPSEFWETLVKEEKMLPKWRNVLLYFTETEEIDEHLVRFLDNANNYIELSEDQIEPDEEAEDTEHAEEISKKLSKELITNSAISDQAFEELAKSITEVYDGELNLETISNKRITTLITNGGLKLSVANFNGLKKNDPMRMLLLNENISTFIDEIQEYSLEPKDLMWILSSGEIASTDVSLIINKISEEVITGQTDLANLICLSLANNSGEIGFEKLKKILTYSNVVPIKLTLLINKLPGKTTAEIDELLIVMGDPYAQISERGKRPAIPLIKENTELVRKLSDLEYISSCKIEPEEGRIRVNTKLADSVS
jgi:hypothetical protein